MHELSQTGYVVGTCQGREAGPRRVTTTLSIQDAIVRATCASWPSYMVAVLNHRDVHARRTCRPPLGCALKQLQVRPRADVGFLRAEPRQNRTGDSRDRGVRLLYPEEVLRPVVREAPADDPTVTDQMWIDAARVHFRGRMIVGKDLTAI